MALAPACLLQLHCHTGEGDLEPLPALAEPRARHLKQPRCEAGAVSALFLMLGEFDSLAPGHSSGKAGIQKGFQPRQIKSVVISWG